MQNITTPEEYMHQVPEERKEAIEQLRQIFKKSLPKGFEETISYGMLAFVVPHHLYPKGYHCKPSEPLPFISIASQKNFIALYHMGLYANPSLFDWFMEAYSKVSIKKPDVGKSCIRFKKTDQIPFNLLAELATKITVNDWIACYEKAFVK